MPLPDATTGDGAVWSATAEVPVIEAQAISKHFGHVSRNASSLVTWMDGVGDLPTASGCLRWAPRRVDISVSWSP